MRFATFSTSDDSAPRVGIVRDDVIVDVGAPSLLELIRSGPEAWSRAAAGRYELARVHLHAPIPRPAKNIVCLGLNYMSHVLETSRPLQRQAKNPEVPIFFTKGPTGGAGP